MDFVNIRRLNRSIQLLRDTSIKVNEIAAVVGINDAHYFSAAFKKYTGVTPLKFRKYLTFDNASFIVITLRIGVNCGGGSKQNLSADRAYSEGNWGYLGDVLNFNVKKKVFPDYGYGEWLNSLTYAGIFWYRFNIPNGYYTVKLYFAELYFDEPSIRCFDVIINGLTVLHDFDIVRDAGGNLQGVEKIYQRIAVTNGVLQTEFSARNNLAQINAIVVEAEERCIEKSV